LYQAGFIRESTAGRLSVATWYPRSKTKSEKLSRRNDRAGGQEIITPTLHPNICGKKPIVPALLASN